MKRFALAAQLVALALAPACSKEENGDAGARPALTPDELQRQMDAAIATLSARPEHGEPRVTVQHLLVGVAGGGTAAQRSPAEARALAGELFGRAGAGEDFDLLVKNHTDEAHPGIYTLVLSGGDGMNVFDRGAISAGLGDAAWRLAVGELGVVPYDGDVAGADAKSPHGFHVVKRLE